MKLFVKKKKELMNGNGIGIYNKWLYIFSPSYASILCFYESNN